RLLRPRRQPRLRARRIPRRPPRPTRPLRLRGRARRGRDRADALAAVAPGSCPSSLDRPIADDGDALHHSPLRPVVRRGVVLHGAVVPERERARLPSESALVLRDGGLLAEEPQQRLAVRALEADEMAREAAVDEERPPARLRVRADDRMLGRRVLL